MALRIIWGAMLMGLIAFLVVVLTIGQNRRPMDPQFSQILFYIAVAMVVTLVPLGLLIRSIIYSRGRDESGGVSPEAYANGNIVFWATCEAAAFFALVGGLLNGGRGPHLFVGVIAMAILLVGFPTGAAMRRE
jgi:hypothetical protein